MHDACKNNHLFCGGADNCVCVIFHCPRAQDLSGLWATDGSKCNQIFTKTGSTYVFAQDSDLHGSGFIIEGRRIITQFAKCDIKTRKQDGETTHLILGCATDVRLSSVQASFKMAQ
jgi:hypothetical protein